MRTLLFIFTIIFLGACTKKQSPTSSTSGIINVFAGKEYKEGSSGNGGSATAALLNLPIGITFDGNGNMYIAEEQGNRIRKINTLGIISAIAGNGVAGYTGDGMLATDAELRQPYDVTIDGNGNVYIADGLNNLIRKVDVTGTISTVAGTFPSGFSGDGGPATDAELHLPSGIAVDVGGNLYISDFYNNRIRKVSISGTISTIAGNGTMAYSGDGGAATAASISNPFGIAVDADGNVFFADYDNSCVRKITTSGIISTVAGTGIAGYNGDNIPATTAQLYMPSDVAIASNGDLYIADQFNNRVRKVTSSTGMISTIAGTGLNDTTVIGSKAVSTYLGNPEGIALDANGNIYVSSPSVVWKINK